MLPERIISSLEKGNIKDHTKIKVQETPHIKATMNIRKRPRQYNLAPIAALLSFSVAVISVATIFSDLVENRKEIALPILSAMLTSSFPSLESVSKAEIDIPANLPVIPNDTEAPKETTAPPETREPETREPEPVVNPPALMEGCYPIIDIDLSAPELGEFYLSNETPYNPDLRYLSGAAISVFKNQNTGAGPLVLILHTHATEAYSEEGAYFYDDETIAPRSNDPKENVIAVGSVMASVLRENGIPTLHCTIMHDKESYKDSYNRSAATIKEYLNKYPSIKYIFDVHRDSLVRDSGEKLRPITEINGVATAQVMSVVGTDYMGAVHPLWENNLSLAARLQSILNERHMGIARHIYLRGPSFNQQYRDGSLLLEIGSCGNSLDEAKRAGVIVAEALSDIIKQTEGK